MLAGYENLVLEGIEGVIHIEHLEINQEINEHARMNIQLLLADRVAPDYEDELLANRDICLCTDDGEILFYGIIVDNELCKTGGVYWLKVSAVSHTILLDIKKKSRSWQDTQMTNGELIQRMIGDYPTAMVLYDDHFESSPVGRFLLQYEETDWEFIKRVASLFNLGLFPEMRRKGSSFSIGIPQTQEIKAIGQVHYCLKQNLAKNQRMRYNNAITGLEAADSIEYVIRDMAEYYCLGEQVEFKGGKFIIGAAHSVLSRQEGSLLSDYRILTEGGCRQEQRYNAKVKGASVPGTVIDVTRGYSRLHLHVDAEQPTAQGSWFVQPSFYTGTGGYCAMPEQGDILNLHFPTEDEGDCYIISSQGAPFEQIEAENDSMMKADAGTADLSSGAAGGGSQPSLGTAGRSRPPAYQLSSEAINKNKKWTTPGGNGLLLNDHQVALYTKGSKARLSVNFSGITITGSGDMEIIGESIDLAGGDVPCLTIKGHATERMSFQCGGSSIMLDGADGKVHVRGEEVFLQSPFNPPPPDLPDADEVEGILAGYEEEKKKHRPVALADGTIMDANNMDEELLYEYFMEFVCENRSDMASYDAFARWRKEVYGLTKKEERWNYLSDSVEFLVKGNYTDKVTGLGIGGSIGLGFLGIDAPADVRDLTHNLTHWEWTWGHAGETVLNAIGLFPMIGVVKNLKYADETGALLKNADEMGSLAKNADRVQEALKLLDKGEHLKYTDELGNVLNIRKVDNGFEILDSTGTVLRKTDNLDEVADAVEALYKGTGKYDINGKYTGGRTQAELDALAKDPAHAGSTRQYDVDQGLLEQKVGLSLEESGKLKGPITRDPTGASEFFDANGQAWDVKSFNSNFKPSKGGYTLQKSMDSILDSLGKNENVLLDTSNLSSVHKAELLQELTKQGLIDKIILWP